MWFRLQMANHIDFITDRQKISLVQDLSKRSQHQLITGCEI